MPTICRFDNGVAVYMYSEFSDKHHVPHIHCIYNDCEVVIDFDGNILAGSISSKNLRMLRKWIAKNRDALNLNWDLLKNGEHPHLINP